MGESSHGMEIFVDTVGESSHGMESFADVVCKRVAPVGESSHGMESFADVVCKRLAPVGESSHGMEEVADVAGGNLDPVGGSSHGMEKVAKEVCESAPNVSELLQAVGESTNGRKQELAVMAVDAPSRSSSSGGLLGSVPPLS